MQNYSVIESYGNRTGYFKTYARSFQEFLANCRHWGVKEVYYDGGNYVAYDGSLMRSIVYFEDLRYCLTVVNGLPFNEFTW